MRLPDYRSHLPQQNILAVSENYLGQAVKCISRKKQKKQKEMILNLIT